MAIASFRLFPCHRGPALRAFPLNAGNSAFMRFAMPAFRTQAGADSAPRKGTAHATSTLSGSTLSLSAAWTHSAAFSSVHRVFLLVNSAYSPAVASTATGATGHDKGVALQVATEPGLNDIVQVTGDERDHLDAIRGDHLVERPGDRAANQRTDAKLHQTMRLLDRQVIRQDFPRFSDDSSRVGLDDVNPPCDVEHRRDPIVPVCKCRFHHPGSCASFLHSERAFAVPIRLHENGTTQVIVITGDL